MPCNSLPHCKPDRKLAPHAILSSIFDLWVAGVEAPPSPQILISEYRYDAYSSLPIAQLFLRSNAFRFHLSFGEPVRGIRRCVALFEFLIEAVGANRCRSS